MSDLDSFVWAILVRDPDAAGPFADWLEERGDPRAALLRRRWKRWRTERAAARVRDEQEERRMADPFLSVLAAAKVLDPNATGYARVKVTGRVAAVDGVFREYVRERFLT